MKPASGSTFIFILCYYRHTRQLFNELHNFASCRHYTPPNVIIRKISPQKTSNPNVIRNSSARRLLSAMSIGSFPSTSQRSKGLSNNKAKPKSISPLFAHEGKALTSPPSSLRGSLPLSWVRPAVPSSSACTPSRRSALASNSCFLPRSATLAIFKYCATHSFIIASAASCSCVACYAAPFAISCD